MKKLTALLTMLALLLTLTLLFTACDTPADDTNKNKGTDAPTAAPTEAPTEAPTAAPTEAPTAAPTEAPTEEPTDPPEADPDDPTETPTPVRKSYDGKYDSYDGRLLCISRDEWFDATDETGLTGEFDSIQDAIDFLEGVGGNVMLVNYGDIGLCLNVVIPDDGCFYRIAYNWNNVDFTFNYGYTYDDGSGGYAYYSQLERLDEIAGLDNTHLYVWGNHDEFPEGYYLMREVGNHEAGNGHNYEYEYVCEVGEVWPGLPEGESYFE